MHILRYSTSVIFGYNRKEYDQSVDIIHTKRVEVTAKETINQIREINTLFIKTQEKVRREDEKSCNKELLELLFEQPYSKSNT